MMNCVRISCSVSCKTSHFPSLPPYLPPLYLRSSCSFGMPQPFRSMFENAWSHGAGSKIWDLRVFASIAETQGTSSRILSQCDMLRHSTDAITRQCKATIFVFATYRHVEDVTSTRTMRLMARILTTCLRTADLNFSRFAMTAILSQWSSRRLSRYLVITPETGSTISTTTQS